MRIRQYPINPNPTNTDMLLGTDSNGLTKNYLLGSLTDFFTSAIPISNISTTSAARFVTDTQIASWAPMYTSQTYSELSAVSPSSVSLGITTTDNKLFIYTSAWVGIN